MKLTKENTKQFRKLFVKNTMQFILIMAFINVCMTLFGAANTLAGVAIIVAIMTYPSLDIGIKPSTMALLIILLFTGAGFASLSVLLEPSMAFIINTGYLILLLSLTSEPASYKVYMPILLCFIFCQSVPVYGYDILQRIVGIGVGGILCACCTYYKWKKNDYGKLAKPLRVQFRHSSSHRGFILRLSLGISFAMFLGSTFHLEKPLWISIVVMSLTQIEFKDTLLRIKHRSLATVVGTVLFLIFFQYLIPSEYAFELVLGIGYLTNFVKAYKYQQILNAINAINASLVILDTTTAIENRFLCLLFGILIVLCFYVLHFSGKKLLSIFTPKLSTIPFLKKKEILHQNDLFYKELTIL